MTLSIQEQALAAFHAALQALRDSDGVTVYRTRDARIADDARPAINVMDGGFDIVRRETGQTLRTLRVDVECFVGADTDAELGPAVTALSAQVEKAGVADPELGGVSQDVRLESQSDPIVGQEEGQPPAAAFTLAFEIDFWTRELDPYTAAP